MAIHIPTEGLLKLGTTVKSHLDTHLKDRRGPIEEQMIRNLRQYRAKYDPSVEKAIPEERSHAYPRDTRVKVKGFVAKTMETMMPTQEENWLLEISPVPSIPEEALQNIITALEIQEVQAAEAEGRQALPITSEEIEREVKAYATARKDAMEEEIADQLADEDTDYPSLVKRVLRSGGIYGIGVARSPMVRKLKERVWELNKETGQYEAKTKILNRPYPEFVRIWDIFPDFSAHTWRGQDRIFERMVLGRHEFSKLGKRPDFISEAVDTYLRVNQQGNYTEAPFEADLRTLQNNSTISDKASRRYEVYRFLGFVDAHEMVAAGIEGITDEQLGQDILADIWIIDDIIIKAKVAAFGERPADQYPAFIASEDEDSGLMGVGMPEDLRDSQMGLCASTRAMFDNMAATAGPILEVNTDLLANGRTSIGPIHSFMTIEREGQGTEASAPAVRQINTSSHIAEIQSIVNMTREQLDLESGLPAHLFGNPEGVGEAFRTTTNLSALTSGANLTTKDTVRAFDQFTMQLIGGMLKWNMEFNDRPDIKGDFNVKGKGAISLASKEVQGAALDQLTSTMSPEEKAMTDTYGILLDKFKSRDLPTSRLLPRDEAEANVARIQQGAAAAAQAESELTASKTQVNAANAGKTTAETQSMLQNANAVLDEIISKAESNRGGTKAKLDLASLENLRTLLASSEPTRGEKA